MSSKAPTGERARRNRVVKGWAFYGHTENEKKAIKHYIDTGEMLPDFPNEYRELNEMVV